MFLPEHIDLTQSEKYNLSIRLTPDGFSFLIFLPEDKSVYFYNESSFNKNLSAIENIKKAFFETNLFTHQFREIFISVVSKKYTIVPKEFFQKKNITSFFNYNISSERDSKVLYNNVANREYNIIYGLDEEIYSFLFRNLWNPTFKIFSASLIEHYVEYGEKDKKRSFVFFNDNLTTVICFNGSELLSANTFESSDKDNITFHIINIWDKHPFDQNNDYLYYYGVPRDITNNLETLDILKQLIRNVEEVKLDTQIDNYNIPIDLLKEI